jgi:hypothetical protein
MLTPEFIWNVFLANWIIAFAYLVVFALVATVSSVIKGVF